MSIPSKRLRTPSEILKALPADSCPSISHAQALIAEVAAELEAFPEARDRVHVRLNDARVEVEKTRAINRELRSSVLEATALADVVLRTRVEAPLKPSAWSEGPPAFEGFFWFVLHGFDEPMPGRVFRQVPDIGILKADIAGCPERWPLRDFHVLWHLPLISPPLPDSAAEADRVIRRLNRIGTVDIGDHQLGFEAKPARYEGGGRETVDKMRDNAFTLVEELLAKLDLSIDLRLRVGTDSEAPARKVIADEVFAYVCETHALKYRDRAGKKGSKEEDLGKADWWEGMELHVLEPETHPDPRSERDDFEPYRGPREACAGCRHQVAPKGSNPTWGCSRFEALGVGFQPLVLWWEKMILGEDHERCPEWTSS